MIAIAGLKKRFGANQVLDGIDLLLSPGRITAFAPPQGPGIRNDVGVDAGSTVSVDYDPMLGRHSHRPQ